VSLDAKLTLAGLLVGLLIGFTGMGGGTLMTPLLLFLGVPAAKAIGSDLFYAAITKTFGSFTHARRGQVDWGIARWLATGSVPAGLAGVYVVHRVQDALGDGANQKLQEYLGFSLIVVGLVVVVRLVLGSSTADRVDTPIELSRRGKFATVLVGVVGGFGVGLTSIGSGTLFAVVLMFAFPLTARRIVGTDIFHATLLLWAAGLAHAAIGNVQYAAVAALLVGSIPGIVVGSRMVGRLPERPVRAALGAVLVLSGALLR
jgi:uncharacterized protein